jgi:hypothetical protein
MKIDINTNTPSHTALLQSFDQQLSLLTERGFPHRHFNAHVLSKFGGDVEKAQEHLEKVRQQRQEKRAETLEVFKSSVDELTERGFGDHPCLPRLLKKFDGDVEQIIARIEKKANKARDPSRQTRSCHKWSRNACWTPVVSSETTTADSSSSSDAPAPVLNEETEISSQTMVDQGEGKCERKAKMQQLRQQIRELQGQMKQMQDENATQARFRQQKKQERLQHLRQRETKILSKLTDLKQKASKVTAMIQKQEEQLERVRSFQAKFTTEA